MTTLNIRIDEKIKAKANKTFEDMGLDMSSAIKLFLTQSIKEKGLPFTPTNNDAVIRARWDKEVAHALKNGKRYGSGAELHKDLLS
ncbi:MAG: Toxin-antitoxin system, antitoxin component, ribbon-helix-helix fold protein [uncultured bacterium]|uniref:Toxin-antitoxin system, antitoxin component, ribbon-helix-helix fold protein n=1 Tax=Candidatus Wolfebacteria bacterium GW2011_GWE2_44_13 TaxID=1619017 RepID=A0A0G1HAH3_9BACT|nr:MAG: Toxin-antitoxin system, antitoxin component, ribbon-helix-helix fold protein [uncultured bacterium]KKT43770.1 MAG: Toxin-antitoxin system, antitoxin component, ribbon-helix-helix fold protein [Candidatus Wolfebacteria bacterium GW2011_GWE2_44_13]